MRHRTITIILLLVLPALLGACIPAMGEPAAGRGSTNPEGAGEAAPAAPETPPPAPSPAPPPPPPPPRAVSEQRFVPFAVTEQLTLFHPAARIEHVGFHESNHDGARQMAPVRTAVRPFEMESRERGTAGRTAADIVADPTGEIRSPVTGTVKRGGSYILYCDTPDHYVVIEPDDRPGWEVKVLHMNDLKVRKGQRVTAGVTVLASSPHPLPFESQVDDSKTTDVAWPHVHIEVVDPAIPDRPSPGRGC